MTEYIDHVLIVNFVEVQTPQGRFRGFGECSQSHIDLSIPSGPDTSMMGHTKINGTGHILLKCFTVLDV